MIPPWHIISKTVQPSLIEVLPQLTELCYDNLIQMKMYADNSPISSLVWVLIIWQLKEPHTFCCRFHLYPQTCLQCLQAGCHAIMLIRFLLPHMFEIRWIAWNPYEYPALLWTWSPEGEHEPTRPVWLGEKMEQFRFCPFFGKLPQESHQFGNIYCILYTISQATCPCHFSYWTSHHVISIPFANARYDSVWPCRHVCSN